MKSALIGAKKTEDASSSFQGIGDIIANVFNGTENTGVLGANYYTNKITERYKKDENIIKDGAFTQECLNAVVLTEVVKAFKNSSKPQDFSSLYKNALEKFNSINNKLFDNLEKYKNDIQEDLEKYWNGLKLANAIDKLKNFEQEAHMNSLLLRLKSLNQMFSSKKIKKAGKTYYILDLSPNILKNRFSEFKVDINSTTSKELLLKELEGVVEIPTEGNNNVPRLENLLCETAKTDVGRSVLEGLKILKLLADEQDKNNNYKGGVEPITFKKVLLSNQKIVNEASEINGSFNELWKPQYRFHLIKIDLDENLKKEKDAQTTLLHELLHYYYSIILDNFNIATQSIDSLNLKNMPEVSEYLYGYNNDAWITERSKELSQQINGLSDVTKDMIMKLHYKLTSGRQYDVLNDNTKNSINDFIKNIDSRQKDYEVMFQKMLVVLYVFERSPYDNSIEMLNITGLTPFEINGKNFLVVSKDNEHAMAAKLGMKLRWSHESDELTFFNEYNSILKDIGIDTTKAGAINKYFLNLKLDETKLSKEKDDFFLHNYLTQKDHNISYQTEEVEDSVFDLSKGATSTSYFYSGSLLENSNEKVIQNILDSYDPEKYGQDKLNMLALFTLHKYNHYAQDLFIKIINTYYERTKGTDKKKILNTVIRWLSTLSCNIKEEVIISAVNKSEIPMKGFYNWLTYKELSYYKSGTGLRKYLFDFYTSAAEGNDLQKYAFALPILCQWGVIKYEGIEKDKIHIQDIVSTKNMEDLQKIVFEKLNESLRKDLFIKAALSWRHLCHDPRGNDDGIKKCLDEGYINESNIVDIMNDDDADMSFLKDMLNLIRQRKKIDLLKTISKKDGKNCFSKLLKGGKKFKNLDMGTLEAILKNDKKIEPILQNVITSIKGQKKFEDLTKATLEIIFKNDEKSEVILQEVNALFKNNGSISFSNMKDFYEWYVYGGRIDIVNVSNAYFQNNTHFKNIYEIFKKHVDPETHRATTSSIKNAGLLKACEYLQNTKDTSNSGDIVSLLFNLSKKGLSDDEIKTLNERIKNLNFDLLKPSDVLHFILRGSDCCSDARKFLIGKILNTTEWQEKYKEEMSKSISSLAYIIRWYVKELEKDGQKISDNGKKFFDSCVNSSGLDKNIADIVLVFANGSHEEKINAISAYFETHTDKPKLANNLLDQFVCYIDTKYVINWFLSQEESDMKNWLNTKVPGKNYNLKERLLQDGLLYFSDFVKLVITGLEFKPTRAYEFYEPYEYASPIHEKPKTQEVALKIGTMWIKAKNDDTEEKAEEAIKKAEEIIKYIKSQTKFGSSLKRLIDWIGDVDRNVDRKNTSKEKVAKAIEKAEAIIKYIPPQTKFADSLELLIDWTENVDREKKAEEKVEEAIKKAEEAIKKEAEEKAEKKRLEKIARNTRTNVDLWSISQNLGLTETPKINKSAENNKTKKEEHEYSDPEKKKRRKYVASILHAPYLSLEGIILNKCLNCWDRGEPAPENIVEIYNTLKCKNISKENLFFEVLKESNALLNLEYIKISDTVLPSYEFVNFLNDKKSEFSKVLSDNDLTTDDFGEIIKPVKKSEKEPGTREIDLRTSEKRTKVETATKKIQELIKAWYPDHLIGRFKPVMNEFKEVSDEVSDINIIIDFYNKYSKKDTTDNNSNFSARLLNAIKNKRAINDEMLRNFIDAVFTSFKNGDLKADDPVWEIKLFENKNGAFSLFKGENNKTENHQITVSNIIEKKLGKKLSSVYEDFKKIEKFYNENKKYFAGKQLQKSQFGEFISSLVQKNDSSDDFTNGMLRNFIDAVFTSFENGDLKEDDPVWEIKLFENKNGAFSLFKGENDQTTVSNIIEKKLVSIFNKLFVEHPGRSYVHSSIRDAIYLFEGIRKESAELGLNEPELEQSAYMCALSLNADELLNRCIENIANTLRRSDAPDRMIKKIFSSGSIFNKAIAYFDSDKMTFNKEGVNSFKAPLWYRMFKLGAFNGINEFKTCILIWCEICKSELPQKQMDDLLQNAVLDNLISKFKGELYLDFYNEIGKTELQQEEKKKLQDIFLNKIIQRFVGNNKFRSKISRNEFEKLIKLPINYNGMIKCDCDVLMAILLETCNELFEDCFRNSFYFSDELYESFKKFKLKSGLTRIDLSDETKIEEFLNKRRELVGNILDRSKESDKEATETTLNNLIDYLDYSLTQDN